MEVVEGATAGAAIAKGAPVAIGGTVSGLSFFGVSIPDLVQILTGIYLVLMILHEGWKWWTELRAKDADDS